jgi:hypothetical protein
VVFDGRGRANELRPPAGSSAGCSAEGVSVAGVTFWPMTSGLATGPCGPNREPGTPRRPGPSGPVPGRAEPEPADPALNRPAPNSLAWPRPDWLGWPGPDWLGMGRPVPGNSVPRPEVIWRSLSCRRRAAISTSRSVTACAIRYSASLVDWTL